MMEIKKDISKWKKFSKIIKRGYNYLERSCENGLYKCYVGSTRTMDGELQLSPLEIGSSLLILETSLRHRSYSERKGHETTEPEKTETIKSIVNMCKKQLQKNRLNFFVDKGLLPDDAETTSYGLSVLLELGEFDEIQRESLNVVLDEIINNVDEKGIMQVYFYPEKFKPEKFNPEKFEKPEKPVKANHVDPFAISNILYLLNLTGREQEAKASQELVYKFLEDKTYLTGSRYYHSPDAFLYFLGRLMKFPIMKKRGYDLVKEELQSRIGSTDFPIDLAMRVTTAQRLGVNNEEEAEKLIALMNKDGSWPIDSIYHYGGKIGYFGSTYISTSFAIEALREHSTLV